MHKERPLREKKADTEADLECPRSRHHVRKLMCAIALGALIGYFMGFKLPEEKRGRLGKLMFEGREMWLRIFV